jgi:hypothetical protein
LEATLKKKGENKSEERKRKDSTLFGKELARINEFVKVEICQKDIQRAKEACLTR